MKNELRGDPDDSAASAVAAEARVERTRARVGVRPGETNGRSDFCGPRTRDESPMHRGMLEREKPRKGFPNMGDGRRDSDHGREGWNWR